MTLQEAKDKAAKNHEFTSWDSLCKMLKRSGVYEANIGVFCDEAAELYAASRAESAVRGYGERQWIAVSERLPDINCFVAVRTSKHETAIMSYHAHPEEGRYFYRWIFGQWKKQSAIVTHWIQLPSPPIK